MKSKVNMKSQQFKNVVIDCTKTISVLYKYVTIWVSLHSLFFITGAKLFLGPNCLISYLYGIIQLGQNGFSLCVFHEKKIKKDYI